MSRTLAEQVVDSVGTGQDVAVFDILEGVTASASELNILDGATVSTAEINKLAGAGAVVPSGTAVANVADVATTGTYADDDDAIVAAINSIKDALVDFGIMAAA